MQLLTILLQAAQLSHTPETTFWGRVSDQAFSIVLLVVLSSVLWRQYIRLEARLNKYMEEDRKQMMDIIQNNTRVMERIEDHLDKR